MPLTAAAPSSYRYSGSSSPDEPFRPPLHQPPLFKCNIVSEGDCANGHWCHVPVGSLEKPEQQEPPIVQTVKVASDWYDPNWWETSSRLVNGAIDEVLHEFPSAPEAWGYVALPEVHLVRLNPYDRRSVGVDAGVCETS